MRLSLGELANLHVLTRGCAFSNARTRIYSLSNGIASASAPTGAGGCDAVGLFGVRPKTRFKGAESVSAPVSLRPRPSGASLHLQCPPSSPGPAFVVETMSIFIRKRRMDLLLFRQIVPFVHAISKTSKSKRNSKVKMLFIVRSSNVQSIHMLIYNRGRYKAH